MVYPVHVRLTFAGVFGQTAAPVERFMFNLSLSGGGTPTVAQATALLAPFATLLDSTFISGAQPEYVKVAAIGADGKYLQASQRADAPPYTGTGAFRYPPQVALVASLHTATRGRSGRGRIYLPPPDAGLVAGAATLSVTNVDAIRDKVKTFLNAIVTAYNSADGGGGTAHLIVASKKGTAPQVTSISVGLALDTMRTRRRSVKESYESVAL